MAIKNQNQTDAVDTSLQPKEGSDQELFDIGDLCKKHRVSLPVFAGVRAANGWAPGKAITEEAFVLAVKQFTGARINTNESEARK